MGLIDMLGGLLGRPSKSGNPIMDALLPMISGRGNRDGLGGLLGSFTGARLGTKANSWGGMLLTGAEARSMKGLDLEAIVGR